MFLLGAFDDLRREGLAGVEDDEGFGVVLDLALPGVDGADAGDDVAAGGQWASPRGDIAFEERVGAVARSYWKYDEDFKQGAVRLVAETGKPIAQVARELGVNEGTLGNWCAKARRERDGGDAVLSDIMRVLPHADLSVTMEGYAKASSDATQESRRRLGESLN